MRKARLTEQQIIAILESIKAGRTVKDVCREAVISEAWYYNLKAKFGRRFRTFNVVDDCNRECLATEIVLNTPALRVVRLLERVVANPGYPLKM